MPNILSTTKEKIKVGKIAISIDSKTVTIFEAITTDMLGSNYELYEAIRMGHAFSF